MCTLHIRALTIRMYLGLRQRDAVAQKGMDENGAPRQQQYGMEAFTMQLPSYESTWEQSLHSAGKK